MRRFKHPDIAKDQAVFTALELVFSAFAIAFAIAFALPPLFSAILSDSSSEATKNTVTVLVGIMTSLFFMVFSAEVIKTKVGLAIDAAVKDKTKDYEEKHPDLVEIEKIQVQEYCCVIPADSISEEIATKVAMPIPSFCSRRAARDAIIRFFAYNDGVLDGIALTATNFALINLNKDDSISKKDYNNFRQDIYAYLKAWLMFSVAHDRPMPVQYIKQRYPHKTAYIIALQNVQSQIKTDKLKNQVKDEKHREKAIEILDSFLSELIKQLS